MGLKEWKRDKGWMIASAPVGDGGGVAVNNVLKFNEDSGGTRTISASNTSAQWHGKGWTLLFETVVVGSLGDGRKFIIVHDPISKKLFCTILPLTFFASAGFFGFNWLKKPLQKLDSQDDDAAPGDAGAWTAVEGG